MALTPNTVVKFDIGGTNFATNVATVMKVEESKLGRMVSGNIEIGIQQDNKGRYFIDRSPTYFSYVLDFLRGVPLELPTSDRDLRMLWHEADFYGLEELKKMIPSHGCLIYPRSTFDRFGDIVLEGEHAMKSLLDHLFSNLPRHHVWNYFWGLPLRVNRTPQEYQSIDFKIRGEGFCNDDHVNPSPNAKIQVTEQIVAVSDIYRHETVLSVQAVTRDLLELKGEGRTDSNWYMDKIVGIHGDLLGGPGGREVPNFEHLKLRKSFFRISLDVAAAERAARREYQISVGVSWPDQALSWEPAPLPQQVQHYGTYN